MIPRNIGNAKRTVRISRCALSIALSVAIACWLVPVTARAGGWETIRTEDGIIVSRQDVPGSPFTALRGEGDVDAPLLTVASVLADVPHSKDWIDHVVESRILRNVSATEYIVYTHIGTPPTMTDRDTVVDAMVSVDAPSRTFTVTFHSVTDPSAPKTNYIRANVRESRWVLTQSADGRKTHVVAEIHTDPKGSIAPWLINLFQKNWGYNTLSSLRRRLASGNVAIYTPLHQYLESLGFPLAPR
jgi:hypothetical protein